MKEDKKADSEQSRARNNACMIFGKYHNIFIYRTCRSGLGFWCAKNGIRQASPFWSMCPAGEMKRLPGKFPFYDKRAGHDLDFFISLLLVMKISYLIAACLFVLPVSLCAQSPAQDSAARAVLSTGAADNQMRETPEFKAAAERAPEFIHARRSRMSEISSIEKSGGVAGVNSLTRLLSDSDPLVRGEAASTLGRVKDPAAFAALKTALKSDDNNTRWGAIQGLAGLNDRQAVPLLISALRHADRNTRWKAAKALGELKDARAIDALIAVARSDKDQNVRLAAIGAITDIGGVRAAVAAEGLKNDPDQKVKASAKAAVDRLKQKK